MASKVLANLYYIAVVVANDMKHVHTHAKGHRFDRIHSICNEYYERASEDADTLVELAIEYDEPVQNGSLAASILNYRPTNQTEYDWDGAMNIVHTVLDYYIKALEEALGTSVGLDPDVENLLQEYLRYWKKENNYKNKARMEDMGTDE